MKLIGVVDDGIDLSAVAVRLIEPAERSRWEELMRAHHYLGLKALVGQSLRYVAHCEGRWLALLGWASAAKKCRARDVWIGWSAPLLRISAAHWLDRQQLPVRDPAGAARAQSCVKDSAGESGPAIG